MFISKESFFSWLDEYTRKKRDDLQFSQTRIPKRLQKITVDFSRRSPLEVNAQFNSLKVERIYTTSSGLDIETSFFICFDQNDIGNVSNAMRVSYGETIHFDQILNKCYIFWTTQVARSADIVFGIDLDRSPNNRFVTISGTVPISGSVNANILNNPLNVNVASSIPLSVSVNNTPTVNAAIIGQPIRVVPWKPSKVNNVYAGGRYKLNEEDCAKVIWCGSTENDENAYAELRIDGKLQAIVRGPLKSYYYECYTKFGQTIACNAESGDSIARLEQY